MDAGHVRFLFFGSLRAGLFMNLSTSFLARLKFLAERVTRIWVLNILFGNLAYILLWLPLLPILATEDLSYFLSFFSDVFKLCLFVILICFCIFFLFPLAWVISIGLGMMFLFAPVTSALCERIGCRIVAFVGGLLGILGFVLSSFVSDVYRLYVTFGILWGVGASMSYLPTLRSLPYWFSR